MQFRGIVREYGSLFAALLRGLDVFLVAVAGIAAAHLYLQDLPEAPNYPMAISIGALLVLGLFPNFGIYRRWRGESLLEELRSLTTGAAVVFGILTAIAFATKTGQEFSRVWFILWSASSLCLLMASRLALRLLLRALRKRGWNQRRILIIGSGSSVDELVAGLNAATWTGLVIDRRITLEVCSDGLSRNAAYLADLTAAASIDEAWIVLPLRDEAAIRSIQYALRHTTVDIRYVPDISSFSLLNQSVSEIAGRPVINLSASGMDNLDHLIKGIEDRVLAILILLLSAPLLLIIAVGVKLSSPGPVLFRQRRAGIGGGTIEVIKFRSMVVHSEPAGQVTQARRGDSRVTPFGNFLRRSSLDELPQFFNVLRGDMSIVGPRPHTLEHNQQYKALVDQYMARHKIKPGITGWAQINGYRGETDTLAKMQRRIEYDLYYMENWSLSFDLTIIGLTIVRELFSSNAY